MRNNLPGKPLVKLPVNQAQHLLPVIVPAMSIIQGQQPFKAQTFFLFKLMDKLGRTEVFKKGAVDKGVAVASEEAEEKLRCRSCSTKALAAGSP